MGYNNKGASRRDFVKTAAVAAGAAGALAACGRDGGPSQKTDESSPHAEPSGLPITFAGYPYDRVQPLIDGRVSIEVDPRMARQTAATIAEAKRLPRQTVTFILDTLEKNGGNISQTAKELGVARSTVYNKLVKYGFQTKRNDGKKSVL